MENPNLVDLDIMEVVTSISDFILHWGSAIIVGLIILSFLSIWILINRKRSVGKNHNTNYFTAEVFNTDMTESSFLSNDKVIQQFAGQDKKTV